MVKVDRCRFFLAMACAGVFLLAACDDGNKKKAAAPTPPDVIISETVEKTVPIIMEFSGTLKAVKSVDIIPRVSGYLNERYFDEGSFVRKGDPLYLIDPRPFQDTLDSLQAQLKYNRASLVFAKKEVKRFTALLKNGNISQQKVDDVVSKEKEAAALVDQDLADIEGAKLDLEFTKITAPFDGRIEQTLVNIGADVTAQKDVLVTLIQVDPIYVVFNLSRLQLFQIDEIIKSGVADSESFIGLAAEIILPDGKPYGSRGKIDFLSSQIDPDTDSVTARAVFPNEAFGKTGIALIPGQYSPVRIFIGQIPNALLIPEQAIAETQMGKNVFVVGADGKAVPRSIEVGSSFDGQRHVTKGLEKGERVIVEGLQKVRPGMVVKATLKVDKPS